MNTTTTTITCPVCAKDALVLGIAPTGGASMARCPHCTYAWSIPREEHHEPMERVERIQLRAEGGRLYFRDVMLMTIYEAGDCDTARWPMTGKKADKQRAEKILASSLYDLRETDVRVSPMARIAILPSGREFRFDDYVS